MKKTFDLTHAKIKLPRMVESARAEVNKYLKRERRKKLPEGVDFWDFDCKFGFTEAEAKVVHVAEFTECINQVSEQELTSFYLEILAKEGRRTKKPKPDSKE